MYATFERVLVDLQIFPHVIDGRLHVSFSLRQRLHLVVEIYPAFPQLGHYQATLARVLERLVVAETREHLAQVGHRVVDLAAEYVLVAQLDLVAVELEVGLDLLEPLELVHVGLVADGRELLKVERHGRHLAELRRGARSLQLEICSNHGVSGICWLGQRAERQACVCV